MEFAKAAQGGSKRPASVASNEDPETEGQKRQRTTNADSVTPDQSQKERLIGELQEITRDLQSGI